MNPLVEGVCDHYEWGPERKRTMYVLTVNGSKLRLCEDCYRRMMQSVEVYNPVEKTTGDKMGEPCKQ